MNHYRKRILITFLCMICLLYGCRLEQSHSGEAYQDTKEQQEEIQSTQAISEEKEAYIFSLEEIPEYSGYSYVILNNNDPIFDESDMTTETFEDYSPLDELGRCGVAYANISIETMPIESRGYIGDIKPAGWHTVKYNELIEGNYLYNRCHLIAYQLAGENANEKNLITGSRWMNTQGMLPFENKIYAYVQGSHNHVLYRVTPIYQGDNLIASGVHMEAKSVEDEGEGICFNVFAYNIQPGITINYKNGNSELSANYEEEIVKANDCLDHNNLNDVKEEKSDSESSTEDEMTYILNVNSKKFHAITCKSIHDMAEKNKMEYLGTREEIIDQGYDPCKRCHP